MIDLDEIEARWAEKHREWTSEATSDIMRLIQYARHLQWTVDDACADARRDERRRAARYIEDSVRRLPIYQQALGPKELRARAKALEQAAWGVEHYAYGPRVEDDDD